MSHRILPPAQNLIAYMAVYGTVVLGGAFSLSQPCLAQRNGSVAERGSDSIANGASSQGQQIDQLIRQHWSDYGLRPSEPADDGKWCRRVYLDVIGRIPTVEEVAAFQRDRNPDKKAALVDRLLNDSQYQADYTKNWTTVWTNIFIGRNGGNERNSLTSREGMQLYLEECFAENRPYNRMVFELLTATGTNKPETEGFNGAVNFLAMKVNDEEGTLATASTARIFLGLQIQCTQCHNHPFNEWKQQKFWEFNAFFRQTRMLRSFEPDSRDVTYAELVDEDYEGEFGNAEDAVIFYELRNGLTKAAYPTFIDGSTLSTTSGFVEDVNRREELAKLILGSEFLDKMIANRMWAHFLGHGFTKPIDDLGPHNSPTHPLLLDYLAQQFREQGYDLKQLMRWIVLSEAYSLSSKLHQDNEIDDPQLGEPPHFSHFYLRQMTAEQLYESLLVATEAYRSRGSSEEQEKAKSEWLRQFVIAFGTDEGDETTTFNGSIPQALMMFNGDLIKEAVSDQDGTFLWELAKRNLPARESIVHLFQAGLARQPTTQEMQTAGKLYVAREGDMLATLQDMWWAVLNSNEFIFNH